MKLNEAKCHFMLYGAESIDHSVNVGPALIKESTGEKLFGVIFDKRLPSDTHTQQLCIMANQHALARISPLMDSKNW